MTATVRNNLEGIKENVISLSMAGKYGEAVRLLNEALGPNIYLMASDDDFLDFIKGWICGEALCSCCDGDGGNCCSVYCVGLVCCFFCCGEDVASACCCDWLSNGCSDCIRSGC